MLLVNLSAATAQAVAPDPGCAVDTAALLKAPPEQFDQDMHGGWRPLGDKPACYGAAADLIAAYRRANWGRLAPADLQSSYSHEAHLRAANGEYRRAISLVMASVDPSGDEETVDYALGRVAFLMRDLPALKAARARMAHAPQPPGFAEGMARFKARYGYEMAWPPNLEVLDGLIACFDKPYAKAYGGDCRPKPAGRQPPGTTPRSR